MSEGKAKPVYAPVPTIYDPPASVADLLKEIEARKSLNLHQKISAMIGDCKRIPKNGWNAWNEFPYVTQADTAAMVSQVSAKYGVTIVSQPVAYPRELEPIVKSFVDKMNAAEEEVMVEYLGGELLKLLSTWREPQHLEWTDKQDMTKMLFEFTVTNSDDPKDCFTRYAWGEGLDNGDKATYKCWSGAEKYFFFKLFQISADTEPDEGGVRADEKRGRRDEFDQRQEDERPKNRQAVARDKENLKTGDVNRGHGNETAQPAVNRDSNAKAPVIKEVERDVLIGSGKNAKEVTAKFLNLTGKVLAVSGLKKGKAGGEYITIVIEGLPDFKIGDNSKGRHDTFHVRHKHLLTAAATVKAGDKIVFDFEQDVTKEGKNPGTVWQLIEDIAWVNSQEFKEGEAVADQVSKGTLPFDEDGKVPA